MDKQPKQQSTAVDDMSALLSGLHKHDIVHTHGGFQYAMVKRVGSSNVFKGKDLRTQRWHKFHATHAKKIEKHMGESVNTVNLDLTESRRFHLQRNEDVHGKSGTGIVAQGIQFNDGKVAMRWLTDTATTVIFDSIDDVEKIHGHEGRSCVVWEESVEWIENTGTPLNEKAPSTSDLRTIAAIKKSRGTLPSTKRKINLSAVKSALEKKTQKEEVEPLEELRRSTLAKYVERAATHDKRLAGERGIIHKLPSGVQDHVRNSIDRYQKKRGRGLKRALKQLAKEEVEAIIDSMNLDLTEEQLQELRKTTLANYIERAGTKAYGHALRSGSAMGKDMKRSQAEDDKARKRLRGIDKAARKLAKEEIENEDQMDELQNFVDAIVSGDTAELEDMFTGLMQNRVANLLDQRREEIAMNMFKDNEPEETEEE